MAAIKAGQSAEKVYLSRDEQYYQPLEKKGYSKQDLVRAKLINPAFLGGPRWPDLRQSHVCLVNRELNQVMIVSDGLSDPFPGDELPKDLPDDFENTGFGYEVFLEGRYSSIDSFIGPQWIYRWEAHLVDYLSQVLANQVKRGLVSLLKKSKGVISIEVDKEHIPGVYEELLSEEKLGVLLILGQVDPSIDDSTDSTCIPVHGDPSMDGWSDQCLDQIELVTGKVHYVAIKVLDRKQLESLRSTDFSDEGRQCLIRELTKNGHYHLNRF